LNQGAYSYMSPLFEKVMKKKLEVIGQSPLPASGIGNSQDYKATMENLMTRISKILD